MKRFRNYIEKWLKGETAKGIYVTLYDIDCCIRIYNSIARKEKPEFINSKVKEILDICGIKTTPKGIGWKVA